MPHSAYLHVFMQYLENLASKTLVSRRVSFCEDKYKKSKTVGLKDMQKKNVALFSEIAKEWLSGFQRT